MDPAEEGASPWVCRWLPGDTPLLVTPAAVITHHDQGHTEIRVYLGTRFQRVGTAWQHVAGMATEAEAGVHI